MEITHRRENDLKLAQNESNFDVVKRKAGIVCNASYGPWNGGAFMKDMAETAFSLSENLDPNDMVLLHFWPIVCECLNLPIEGQGEAGRK